LPLLTLGTTNSCSPSWMVSQPSAVLENSRRLHRTTAPRYVSISPNDHETSLAPAHAPAKRRYRQVQSNPRTRSSAFFKRTDQVSSQRRLRILARQARPSVHFSVIDGRQMPTHGLESPWREYYQPSCISTYYLPWKNEKANSPDVYLGEERLHAVALLIHVPAERYFKTDASAGFH